MQRKLKLVLTVGKRPEDQVKLPPRKQLFKQQAKYESLATPTLHVGFLVQNKASRILSQIFQTKRSPSSARWIYQE